MAPRNHSTTPPSEASAYDKRERSPTNIPVGNSRATRGSALTTPPSSAPPSTVTHADERAAAVQVPPFGDCCGATQFERADASGTNRQAMLGELVEVLSGGSQPLPSELKANAVRSRRDSAERRATNCSGPAHGEHPVVNGKAGAARAPGSTPPSSTNFLPSPAANVGRAG